MTPQLTRRRVQPVHPISGPAECPLSGNPICEMMLRPKLAHMYGQAAFHNGFGAVTEVAHMYPAY